MSDDELTSFLAGGPTGAICVVDDDGDLLALPGRVSHVDDITLTVVVDGADHDVGRTTSACVVADTFTAYRDIRGVIVQGTVTWPPAPQVDTRLTITRSVTFSFDNA
jgi:hypothetical protein